MDVQLPGIDGLVALARLLAGPEHGPAAGGSADGLRDEGDRDRLLAAGFDGYLEKPLDVCAFPGQIAALLNGSDCD